MFYYRLGMRSRIIVESLRETAADAVCNCRQTIRNRPGVGYSVTVSRCLGRGVRIGCTIGVGGRDGTDTARNQGLPLHRRRRLV